MYRRNAELPLAGPERVYCRWHTGTHQYKLFYQYFRMADTVEFEAGWDLQML
jgi:hypothetical protein